MSIFPFQECKHLAFFYDSEQQRDDEVVRFINEGLAHGQICIYGTIHLSDKEYFKTISSRIIAYGENVKKGNLMVMDFLPFYLAALKQDFTPYKEVAKMIEKMPEYKKDRKIRYVGDATGYLFKNEQFDECIKIESWWQNNRMPAVTTLCLFDKSLMTAPPFDQQKKRVANTHDIVLNW